MIKIKIEKKKRNRNLKDLLEDIPEDQVQAYKEYRNYNKKTVETASNYLNIWERSPSFKDIKSELAIVKVGVVGALIAMITIFTYILFLDIIASITAGIICLGLFIIAFHDQFFFLKDALSFGLKSASRLYPFMDIQFWMVNSKPDILLYTNKKQNMTVGVKIFRIKKVAENIEPNYLSFLKGLANNNIPFTFQVIQQPFIGTPPSKRRVDYNLEHSSDSLRSILYFCTYYKTKGTNKKKIGYLLDVLDLFSASLNNAFKANYRHYKIKLLEEERLVNGFQTIFTRTTSPQGPEKDYKSSPLLWGIILKSSFLTIISLYGSLLLYGLGVHLIFIFLFVALLNAVFFSLFWRDLLFLFSRASAFHEDSITFIDPFEGVRFYYYKRTPEFLFTLVDRKLLIGTKIFNHTHIIPPFLDSRQKPIAKIEKFMESMIPSKIPVTLTTQVSPVHFSTLEDLAWDHLLERFRTYFLKLENANEREKQLQYRYGIYRTILTMGIHEIHPIKKFSINEIARVEEDLQKNTMKIMSAFEMKMNNHKGIMLKGKKLLSGYLFECLKSKFFRLNGSHLQYFLIQGAYLEHLITIYPDLKKGLPAQIGAEFNAPLHLENTIVIGNSINTEFYEKEIKAGFRKDQLGDILITGGTNDMREMAMMRIAMALIQERLPCIVFDYTGNWSKILSYFKGSRYDDKLEYFSHGISFSLNLMHSGIPYDQNNPNYLDLMITALGLAFQKDERAMDAFRAKLRSDSINLEDFASLSFMSQEEKDKPEWQKNNRLESVLNLFEEFTHQNLDGLSLTAGDVHEDAIGIIDFIKDDANIILDCSKLKNARKKMLATLIVLAKIIHNIESDTPYQPKIVFIPNLDIAFSASFLNKTSSYHKIEEFLEPLRRNKFGIIGSTGSIKTLHSHAYTFFRNFVAFKITDQQDSQIIDKLMNFRSLHNKGMFGKERKEAFQQEYLRTQEPQEAIIKRSDIKHPFPVKWNVKDLVNTPRMKKEEIMTFMVEHGHNMVAIEQRIIEGSKKTLFQKDLDMYYAFIDEIIGFLDAVRTVQDVSGNYKNVLKEELLKFITPRAVKVLGTSKKKKKIVQFRNDIFDILLKHDYLVENHPFNASGSEAIRTSYRVGPQYDKALEQYNKKKETEAEHYFFDTIEMETNNQDLNDDILSSENMKKKSPSSDQIVRVLVEEMTGLFDVIFQIHRTLKKGDFLKARDLERDVISNYFERVYSKVYNTAGIPNEKELSDFISRLTEIKEFSVSYKEIETLMNRCRNVKNNEDEVQLEATALYEALEGLFHELFNNLESKRR